MELDLPTSVSHPPSWEPSGAGAQHNLKVLIAFLYKQKTEKEQIWVTHFGNNEFVNCEI